MIRALAQILCGHRSTETVSIIGTSIGRRTCRSCGKTSWVEIS